MALPSNPTANSPPPAATSPHTRGILPTPLQPPRPPHTYHQQPFYRHATTAPHPPPRGYTVPPSGRPFRPVSSPISNPNAVGSYGQGFQMGVRGFGLGQPGHPVQGMRPTHLPLMGPGSTHPIVRGIPVSNYQKAVPSPAAHDGNGYKNQRDKSDNFVTVRDRKVKVSSSSSLYAACRSWLRNGFSEESKPHYLDNIKFLPKPSPPPVPDAHSPAEQEPNKEEEEESVENLSAADLLKRHVKRAKKVRSRLREERLQRIARYKQRLSLLLPPLVVEQPHHQFRNETAAGN